MPGSKKALLIASGLVAACLFVCLGCSGLALILLGGSKSEKQQSQAGGQQQQTYAETVNALLDEWHANEVAATRKYQGSFVWATGTVNRVVSTDAGPLVLLTPDRPGGGQVDCQFASADDVVGLKGGQSVTIGGSFELQYWQKHRFRLKGCKVK